MCLGAPGSAGTGEKRTKKRLLSCCSLGPYSGQRGEYRSLVASEIRLHAARSKVWSSVPVPTVPTAPQSGLCCTRQKEMLLRGRTDGASLSSPGPPCSAHQGGARADTGSLFLDRLSSLLPWRKLHCSAPHRGSAGGPCCRVEEGQPPHRGSAQSTVPGRVGCSDAGGKGGSGGMQRVQGQCHLRDTKDGKRLGGLSYPRSHCVSF